MEAGDIINLLKLTPLPEEGGFYKETHRAKETIGGRSISTCIYFLQTPGEFSAFHLLKTAEEIWHFYAGDAIDLVLLDDKTGGARHIALGPDLSKGHIPQYAVPSGTYFGSRLFPGGRWGLVGCTVTPGFEFSDFAIGNRGELLEKYPKAEKEILQLTR